ncbi:hypothetical protein, partial [Arthrobacter oryzae]|uniref:hypothetical protein n=1 Tax=Arthrobacter oryzae TaxID=409290 RepID=UPI0027D7FA0C
HGVAAQHNQPITLHNRYQQTWHTIEFSNNRHIRIFPETIQRISIPYFFAAMFLSYFIHIHFCKSGYFPGISLAK